MKQYFALYLRFNLILLTKHVFNKRKEARAI